MRFQTSYLRSLAAVAILTTLALGGAGAPPPAAPDQCAWLNEAAALQLTAAFDWRASGADRFGTATISRYWQIEARLERRGRSGTTVEYGVTSPPSDLAGASYAFDDVYAYDTGTETVRGAGAPSEAEVLVWVDRRTCAIDAELYVAGEVAFESPQGSYVGFPNVGGVHLFDVVTIEEFLGGTLDLPHLRDAGLEESHFFPGWFTSAEVALMEADLGTASFTWSIQPVAAP